jgi:sulfite exporter TauE/SafE/copper chaperone CopZ
MNKNYQKLTIPIKGMHCKSCEILLEDELIAVPGVEKIKADWHKSEVEIKYEGRAPDDQAVNAAIGRAGYSIGRTETKGFFSRSKQDYQDLGLAALFLLGLYFILRGFGLTNLSVDTSQGVTVPIILLVGLTAGFSTCMALAGGLVLGVSARYSEDHPAATPAQKFYPHLFFNSGRLLSYMLLGGLLGVIGSAFQLSGTVLGFITLAVALVMLVMGLQLIEIFPWFNKIKFTLPKSFSRALGLKDKPKGYSHNQAFILGALTFFLPCGFTQAMQIYAISTGSFLGGAITMGAFALGTMPGLLSIGGLTSVVKGNFARRFFKFAGLAVIVFGLLNLSHSLTLLNWNFSSSAATVGAASDPNVTLENGVQVVNMAETANGYVPNSFTIKKGVPVKWVIDAQAPYSCASTILLNKYNIRQSLTAGQNIIEFTPTESGRLPFSCSMGMYTGVFNMTDDSGSAVNSGVNNVNPVQPAQAAGGGSCGVTAGSGGGCGCGGGGKKFTPSTGSVTTNSADTAVVAPVDQKVADVNNAVQNINSTFTVSTDIVPNTFTVKVGAPVHYVIDVKENGAGCMSAITIQSLYNQVVPLVAGQPVVMDFTPTAPGSYLITCGMGIPRGKIIVE